jgi:predicted phosphodiesterase
LPGLRTTADGPLSSSSQMSKKKEKQVSAFVLSDIHAFDKALLTRNEDDPSFVDISKGDTHPSSNPLVGLEELIRQQSLTADLLICCGDFCNKAQPAAMRYAWRHVIKIQGLLGARDLAVTVGNHDVDSRHQYNDHDAKGFIQALDPGFPVTDEQVGNRFWAQHYYIIERKHYRVVVLNSSAFHGEAADEREHGRVSSRTLERLKGYLIGAGSKPINLLVCHHHPHKHSELKLGDYDEMQGGYELLHLLETQASDWIVIHGHKHHPKICNASGSSKAPVIFSAGSLSARLYPELANNARNQCYFLEFPLEQIASIGLVGRFRAWDWAVGAGWSPASQDSNIPRSGGFGARANLKHLARKVRGAVRTKRAWAEVLEQFDEISFLLPQDQVSLLKELRNAGLRVLSDEQGIIQELQRK